MQENVTLSPPPSYSSTRLVLGGIGLFLGGGVLGFYLNHYSNLPVRDDGSKVESAQIQSNCPVSLAETQKKLQYCYDNRAEMGVTTREPYSFETFGIYSPLLDGSTVEVTEFNYKEQIITQKTARILGQDGVENTVEVWSSNSSGDFIGNEYPNFPTFGGYENTGTPIYIADIVREWDKQTYTSKSGNTFHYSYYYAPEGITSVMLDLVSTYSPLGKPILVRIYQPIRGDRFADVRDHDTAAIREAKVKLRALADTVEIKL